MKTQYISELRYNDHCTVIVKHRYKIGDVIQYFDDDPLEIVDIKFYNQLQNNDSMDPTEIIYVYNTQDGNDFDFIRDVDGWDMALSGGPVLVSG